MKRQNQKGMILAIDMGNTNIVIGCVDDEKIYFEERLCTDYSKTELEYAIGLRPFWSYIILKVNRFTVQSFHRSYRSL